MTLQTRNESLRLELGRYESSPLLSANTTPDLNEIGLNSIELIHGKRSEFIVSSPTNASTSESIAKDASCATEGAEPVYEDLEVSNFNAESGTEKEDEIGIEDNLTISSGFQHESVISHVLDLFLGIRLFCD